MPRGRKKTVNLSYEQRIEEIEGKIEAHKNAISDLKKELKRLTAEKEQADLEKICACKGVGENTRGGSCRFKGRGIERNGRVRPSVPLYAGFY